MMVDKKYTINFEVIGTNVRLTYVRFQENPLKKLWFPQFLCLYFLETSTEKTHFTVFTLVNWFTLPLPYYISPKSLPVWCFFTQDYDWDHFIFGFARKCIFVKNWLSMKSEWVSEWPLHISSWLFKSQFSRIVGRQQKCINLFIYYFCVFENKR
jgi:hypothetical protein